MVNRVLLVNPFSSASYLAKSFRAAGIHTTALYTIDLTTLDDYHLPRSKIFDEQICFCSNNVNEIINHLGSRKFIYVINGSELSVEISDKLAEIYTPQYANNPLTYLLRADKYEMYRALCRERLPHIRQILYRNNGGTLPDITEYGFCYPCFVKPRMGTCSIGARKVMNPHELRWYFQDIAKDLEVYRSSVSQEEFLISEFIDGIELLVDTFSVNGQHYISSIQRYHKKWLGNMQLNQYCEIEYDSIVQRVVSDYIKRVLDAIGHSNGFAHSELFLLADGSVRLIEVNPRVSGGYGAINNISSLSGGRRSN